MNKLYYSDGKAVKNGDVVKCKYEEEDEYAEEYYITIFNDKYHLDAAVGSLGEIDTIDDYELVERQDTSRVQSLIDDVEFFIHTHDQSNEFGEIMKAALCKLIQAKVKIKWGDINWN